MIWTKFVNFLRSQFSQNAPPGVPIEDPYCYLAAIKPEFHQYAKDNIGPKPSNMHLGNYLETESNIFLLDRTFTFVFRQPSGYKAGQFLVHMIPSNQHESASTIRSIFTLTNNQCWFGAVGDPSVATTDGTVEPPAMPSTMVVQAGSFPDTHTIIIAEKFTDTNGYELDFLTDEAFQLMVMLAEGVGYLTMSADIIIPAGKTNSLDMTMSVQSGKPADPHMQTVYATFSGHEHQRQVLSWEYREAGFSKEIKALSLGNKPPVIYFQPNGSLVNSGIVVRLYVTIQLRGKAPRPVISGRSKKVPVIQGSGATLQRTALKYFE